MRKLCYLIWIYFLATYVSGCKYIESYGEAQISNKTFIEGMWIKVDLTEDDDIPIGMKFYFKVKKSDKNIKLWYSVGPEAFLEEYDKLICDVKTCKFVGPHRRYHQLVDKLTFISIDKNHINVVGVPGKISYFTDPAGIYFVRAKDNEQTAGDLLEKQMPGK
ncbi:hypothetical protein [Leptospira ilyithenensis]|uniref:Uncharacterized protein n=1 Tax=Leptospira ilyithenensis TaxID=2484901 RepID=A0A4R9LKI9_9LEPT|nr:hypothetical protein [Leptospira ilyithenensis]TGN04394.1 hypothetical protein EHS11_19730 [Leptospira ilyithenensis]